MSTPPTTRVCPTCAAPASSWAQFCRECGTVLPAPGQLSLDHPDQPVEQTVPWRAREGLLIWLGAFFVTLLLSAAAVAVTGTTCSRGAETASPQKVCDGVFVATLIVNELALLLLTTGWVRYRHGLGWGSLGLRRPTARALGLGLATAAVGMVVAYGITALIGEAYEAIAGKPMEMPKQVDLQANPGVGLLVLLGVVVVGLAPLAEEMFFRGFVYRSMRRWAAPASAAVLSGLVFGAAHFIPLVVISTALLGIVLARVVEREGDIMAAVVAHIAFNAVGFTLLLTAGDF